MNKKTTLIIMIFMLGTLLILGLAPTRPAGPLEAGIMSKRLYPLLGVVLIGGTASLITMNAQFKRDPSPNFNENFHKSLPGDYSPAEVSYLLGNGKVGADALMATIVDLVRKKRLEIVPAQVYERGTIIFGGKTEEKYRLMLREGTHDTELNRHEEFLIKWFLEDLTGSEGLILDDLKGMVKHRYDASKFRENLGAFTVMVGNLISRRNFFTFADLSRFHIYWLTAAGLLFTGCLAIAIFKAWVFGVSAIFLGLLHPVYLLAFRKKLRFTKEGIDQVAKWKAFRRFLLHISDLNSPDIPSIVTVEHYLVYAISLGVAKELLEELSQIFREGELKDPSLSYLGKDDAFKTFEHIADMLNSTLTALHCAVQTSAAGVSKLPV